MKTEGLGMSWCGGREEIQLKFLRRCDVTHEVGFHNLFVLSSFETGCDEELRTAR